MRKLHHRPFHRPRRGLSTLNSQLSTRPAFTLIELIIVVLVLLILMTLTIALVGNVLDGGRTRGAARQIQTYFAGARDRAIYSASRTEGAPRVGVRFLSNRALVVQDASGNNVHRGFSGMVYIQELDPVQTFLRAYEKSPGQWVASQLTFDTTTGNPILPPLDPGNPTIAVGELINRGLIDVRREPWSPNPDDNTDFIAYYLHVTFDGLGNDGTGKDYYVRFHETDLIDDGSGTLWLVEGELSALLPWRAAGAFDDPPEICNFHLLPSPLPNVEPRMFPTGTIVEITSSVVGTAPRQGSAVTRNVSLRNLSRADGSFDVMFNAQGVVDGALGAAGMLHLVVADLEDIERGFQVVHVNQATGDLEVGSPFIDINGDWSDGVDPLQDGGEPVFRQGDVRIVSLRTRTGSAYVSEVNPQIDNTTNRFIDPFGYAETGGEAN